MSIRSWTEDELADLLTQDDINALLDGTEVLIKWSGGNGPHEYTIKRHVNDPVHVYAATRFELEILRLNGDYFPWGGLVKFAGRERCHTGVILKP